MDIISSELNFIRKTQVPADKKIEERTVEQGTITRAIKLDYPGSSFDDNYFLVEIVLHGKVTDEYSFVTRHEVRI